MDDDIAKATEFQRRRNLPGVEVRYMSGTRYQDVHLSLCGKDLGSAHKSFKRGKLVGVLYVLPDIATL